MNKPDPIRSKRVTLSEQLRRGDLMSDACPSREVLKHLTNRWGVLVLIVLLEGTHRFSELRRKIGGISERMLAQSLQWLEGDGMVDRTSYPVVPPHVEYRLTPLGRAAAKKVRSLADWIEVSMPEISRVQAPDPATCSPLAKPPSRPSERIARAEASDQ